MSELRSNGTPGRTPRTNASTASVFEEALTVFSDEGALLLDDPDHSADEDRFILLGLSASLRALVVCHCYREAEDLIRIFSARKATRTERAEYERRWKP